MPFNVVFLNNDFEINKGGHLVHAFDIKMGVIGFMALN